MLKAIVGVNWGDEGKGRMVDMHAQEADIVVRYQGGNNAGHTVVNPFGKFALNLIPCGIFNPACINLLGTGMVIDAQHLAQEIASLREKGVKIDENNLKISDRAVICLPYHVLMDALEEDRLGDAKFGSTRRGIAYVYGDKYMKKAIRFGDLGDWAALEKTMKGLIEWKNLSVAGVYGASEISLAETLDWLKTYALPFQKYVVDAGRFLTDAAKAKKEILFEAQLGTLRDIDFGIYPYTTSSQTLAAYAPIGAGAPNLRIDRTLGVAKAYSSCVGEGPFAAEFFGPEAHALREAGHEYGAATGRPRRVGAFDAVATAYGARVQGADSIALTLLDVLSYMDEIPVCVAYEIDGERVTDFPYGSRLGRAKPVIETLPGWKEDISACRSEEELPKAAREYIAFVEKKIGVPIEYVSVGPERSAYI
ncbi:MAG: adenylosuccinate synthase, partial [Christensenellaceae bacterium]|nr:adenylosuccinate synthase [Christensenellaceae bacterium]